ncbi:TPA: hypothetical protein U1617_002111 [Streptococcus suis]|nr:hypothetical protein [Streptococcus suis]HEM5491510.1 hypothetical protein [Streptococcus suis]
MKKVNHMDITCFVQLIAIVYLVFVLLADIMKWQQLDKTHVVLAICAIVVTDESLRKLGGRKSKRKKIKS